MGPPDRSAAPQVSHSALLRRDPGQYVHAHRHIDQSGDPRNDARSRIRRLHDVRIRQGRSFHCPCRNSLHDFFAAKRLPGESFSNGEEYPARKEESRIVEAVLGPGFPASTAHSGSSISAPITEPRFVKSAGVGSLFPIRRATRSARATRWYSTPMVRSSALGAIQAFS